MGRVEKIRKNEQGGRNENIYLNFDQEDSQLEHEGQVVRILKNDKYKLSINLKIIIMSTKPKNQAEFIWDFFSGGIAGIISKTVVAPI